MTNEARGNLEWVADLGAGGARGDRAAADLAAYLRRMLGRAFGGRFDEAGFEDLLQDALARILEGLPGYRAEAAFTTWAAAVGLRAGYTRLRRARVRRGETHPYELVLDEARDFPDEGVEDPHRRLEAEERVAALRRAVAGVLTERQRAAILGELRGIPTVELAARMGLTQNALYKLVHDARRKLASALRASGHGPETAGGRA